MRSSRLLSTLSFAVGGVALLQLAATRALGADQLTFKTPRAALQALAEATGKDDVAKLRAILGPDANELVSTGDDVQDAASRKRFTTLVRERSHVEALDADRMVAYVGKEDWPLPIPIVKEGNAWRFDTAAGKQELLNRRIGRDELSAIAVCRDYVHAQHEYAAVDRTGAGAKTYAQQIMSTPGKRDGLYWDDETAKVPSPFGPRIAEAAAESYHFEAGVPAPYHGYYFRVLTAQGPKAPGGAKSYVKDGKMTGGFAFVAYPSEYGASGIMTFVVNQQGIVFQKNLGEKTTELAKAMSVYEPDDTWDPVK